MEARTESVYQTTYEWNAWSQEYPRLHYLRKKL